MIFMAGIDYKLAPIGLRERFSLSGEGLDGAYLRIKDIPGVSGAVIISTCNRTELYLSADAVPDPFEALCRIAGVQNRNCPHYSLSGSEVMRHLCMLASGFKSQVWGEDQIISQVRDALAAAREHHASDNMLEVMFRDAVAAAKKIKSEIKFTGENSVVHRAMDVLRARGDIKRVLVIGNGEIGRLMARMLVENGYHTTMTLRTYRHGESVVPAGVHTSDYADRYLKLAEFDALVSATRSPHHTMEADRVRETADYPKLWLDLAVPRDIDPAVQTLPGVTYYDLDSLCGGEARRERGEHIKQAEPVIDKYIAGFEKWLEYRKTLDGDADRQEFFPLFVSSKGKKALVAGGGKIASRRVNALLRFEFEVTVVAPEPSPEIEELHETGKLTLMRRRFEDTDLDGCFLAVAATGDREVNRHIGELADARGVWVSVADRRDECGFLFPAIVTNGDIVAGVTSGGKSHHAVRDAARLFREVLE